MDEQVLERIERAKYLLAHAQNAAMATVNADGSPHNTPYLFMRSGDLSKLYWGSHPDSEHSKNIVRTGQLFVVLYEADQGGGLYIRADAAHICEGDKLLEALQVHNARRAEMGKEPLPPDYYQTSPQQMYMATVQQLWVNSAIRDADGKMIQDTRHEITKKDLLK